MILKFLLKLNDIQVVYKNIEEYNPKSKRKVLAFDDMIADMVDSKKLNPIVTELFIRGRKLNISKEIRLNITHFFTMKISNKREF